MAKRSYLVTLDTNGQWNCRLLCFLKLASSIPYVCTSSSISGRVSHTNSSSKGKLDHKSKKKDRKDRRTWIWSRGWKSSEIFTSGFNYVALQGNDTICVVTVDKKMGYEKHHMLMAEIINEIKVNGLYGDSKRESGKYLGMLPEDEDMRPFAAVNVVLQSGDEASGVGIYEKEVIGILMRKVHGPGFGYEETIQTAISAVLKMERKPCRLKVCVWKKGSHTTDQLSGKEMEEHLEAINNRELVTVA